jgi:hypothetical protein
VVVRLVYDATFELGYTYHLAIERVLEGELPPLQRPDPPQFEGVDGVLVLPPFRPGGGDYHLGKDLRATLSVAGPVQVGELEQSSAMPGSGLGEFAPPFLVTDDDRVLEVLSLEPVPNAPAS